MIVKIIAVILILNYLANIVLFPFLIGKEKHDKYYTAVEYIIVLFFGSMIIYICGIILGLW